MNKKLLQLKSPAYVYLIFIALFSMPDVHAQNNAVYASSAVIALSNEAMGNIYTGRFYIGSPKQPVDLIIDTGSSSLAVFDKNGGYGSYDPSKNTAKTETDFYQNVGYVDGTGWRGHVRKIEVGLQNKSSNLDLNDAYVAVTCLVTVGRHAGWGKSGGILGLAFQPENGAVTNIPRDNCDKHDTDDTTIKPYFNQLVDTKHIPNKFALFTRRSIRYKGSDDSNKPNSGLLILGSGEERMELYQGAFSNVKLTGDDYYNTNLKAVRIYKGTKGADKPIPAATGSDSPNSLVDSGASDISFGFPRQWLIDTFTAIDPHYGELIKKGLDNYVPLASVAGWPDIELVLEGDNGQSVTLTVAPDTYWQLNATSDGKASLQIDACKTPTDCDNQSNLGLPLLNNYYVVFDRATGPKGRLRFAQQRSTPPIVGVGEKGNLFLKDTLESDWVGVPNSGYVKDIARMPDGRLLGVSNDLAGELFTKDSLVSNWIKVPGSGSVISISMMAGGKILGVGRQYNLFVKDTLNGPWNKKTFDGAVSRVAVLPNGNILAASSIIPVEDPWPRGLMYRTGLSGDWVKIDNYTPMINISALPNNAILGIDASGVLMTKATLQSEWKVTTNRSGSVVAADWLCNPIIWTCDKAISVPNN